MRAAEPVCRVICTAAYFEEYRRKYFPELFEAPAQLSWDQALEYISAIDPRLALGLAAGVTVIAGGATYLLKKKDGKAVVEQLPPSAQPVTDLLEDVSRKEQAEAEAAAVLEEALKKQQLEEAARIETLKKQQAEEAAREEALRRQQLEEAARIEALRQQQLEEAARIEAVKKQKAEEAARIEALKKQQAEKAKQEQEAKRRAQEQAAKRSVDVVALSQPQGAVAQRSQAELLAEQSQRLVAVQEALAKQAPRALPVVAAPSVEKADEPTTVKERMARARQVAESETALKLQQMPVRTPGAEFAVAPKQEVGQKLAVTPLVTAYLASTKATPVLRQRYKMPQEKNKVVNEVLAALHSNGSVPTSAQEIADFNQGIEELEAALDAKLEQTQGEMERAALISHKSTVHSYRM